MKRYLCLQIVLERQHEHGMVGHRYPKPPRMQAGANLNREWEAPSAERSPEVLLVRNKMDKARPLAQQAISALQQVVVSLIVMHYSMLAGALLRRVT